MPDLSYPGLTASITVPDDSAGVFVAAGWKILSLPAAETPVIAAPVKKDPPPQSGPGSGAPAWRKYKSELGIATPEDAELGRDELIDKIEAAGFPVE